MTRLKAAISTCRHLSKLNGPRWPESPAALREIWCLPRKKKKTRRKKKGKTKAKSMSNNVERNSERNSERNTKRNTERNSGRHESLDGSERLVALTAATQDIFATCPHCGGMIHIPATQINCNVFRHAFFKSTGLQIDPHTPKIECDRLLHEDLIWGVAGNDLD